METYTLGNLMRAKNWIGLGTIALLFVGIAVTITFIHRSMLSVDVGTIA